MIRKTGFVLGTLVIAALAWVLLAGTQPGPPGVPGQQVTKYDRHPGYPDNKTELEATTCRQCHMDVTPRVYRDWSGSKHGVDNVRCFVCHGDFQTFRKSPGVETCRGCHAEQYEQCMLPKGKKDKTCWSCHPEHALTVHKTYKTKASPLY